MQEYEEHEVLERSPGLKEIERENITEEHDWQESEDLEVHETHVAERTNEQHGTGNQTGLTHQEMPKIKPCKRVKNEDNWKRNKN